MAKEAVRQIRSGNCFFVTKANEAVAASRVQANFGANEIQCEGCDRGEPIFYTKEGGYFHPAPEINGMKSVPFRCLKKGVPCETESATKS